MCDHRQHYILVHPVRRGVGGVTGHFINTRSRTSRTQSKGWHRHTRNAHLNRSAARRKTVSARYRKREATGFPKRQ
jgi:hypothetical protein